MARTIEIDLLVEAGGWEAETQLSSLAASAVDAARVDLALSGGPAELSIVLTDDAHIRGLNAQWRGKDKATNVLSFPASQVRPGDPLPPLLGDIVVAYETLANEAELEAKPFDHHLSHLIVHGFLHLLGYDHETEAEAEAMEAAERRILARLAIPDPYALSGKPD